MKFSIGETIRRVEEPGTTRETWTIKVVAVEENAYLIKYHDNRNYLIGIYWIDQNYEYEYEI